jgi:hypothetical protein
MENTINLQQLVSKIDKLADAIKGTSSITNRQASDKQIVRPSVMQGITSIGRLNTISGLAKATGLTSATLDSDNTISGNDLSEKELESQQTTKEVAKNIGYLPVLHDDMVEIKNIFKDGLESVKKAVEDNANPGLLDGLGGLITGLFSGLSLKGIGSAVGNIATKAPGAIKSVAKGITSVATNPWAVGTAAMLYSPELNQGENAATDEEFYKKLQKNKSKSIPESEWAGEFAEGGTIPPGKVGLVGENGPELVEGYAKVTNAEDYAKMMKEGGDKLNKELEQLKLERYTVEKLMSPEGIDGKHLTDLSPEDQKKAQEIYMGHPQKIQQYQSTLNSPEYKDMMSDQGIKEHSLQFQAAMSAKKQYDAGIDPSSIKFTDEEKSAVQAGANRAAAYRELAQLKKQNADLGYKDTSVRLGKKDVDSADKLLTSSAETDMAKNASNKGKSSQNIVNAPTTINKQTTQNNITPNFKDNDSTIKDYYRSRYAS